MKKWLLLALMPASLPALADQQAGISIGTPSAVNFVYKGDVANIPVQVSGAYWGDAASGIEVGYRFMQRESAFSSAQVVAGYSRVEDANDQVDEWTYIGVSATFSYKGFYVEPGLSVGTGDYSNPQLLVQAGYTWHF